MTTSKEILVCLEGSPTSERALEVATSLGRRLGATLVGMAVIDEPDIRAGQAVGIGGTAYKQQRDEALVKDAEAHAHEWVTRFLERCAVNGIPARPLERRGQPEALIVEEAEKVALTVMGRHVNFRFETNAQDRETRDRVLHRVRKPVVVVPEPEFRGPRGTVLIAYDGSSAAKRAVESFATSGLGDPEDPVHVVSVGDDGASAYELAERGVRQLVGHGVRATPHSVVSTLSVAEAILKERARFGAWMLVSGAYAHSRVSELIWGSVTRELIEKSDVPLFLHH